MDPEFSEGGGGGGLTVMRGRMAVARGRVLWKLLPCVLTFVAIFAFAPFHAINKHLKVCGQR